MLFTLVNIISDIKNSVVDEMLLSVPTVPLFNLLQI